MKILFLDDNFDRHKIFRSNAVGHSVLYAVDADSAIHYLAAGHFDLVYLDHDLGGPESENRLIQGARDGRYVASWIGRNAGKFRRTQFVIHSLNWAGAREMMGLLQDAALDVLVYPLAWKCRPTEFATDDDS